MRETRAANVMKFGQQDVPQWLREGDKIAFGDVFREGHGESLDVTFIRWAAGHEGPFPEPLPYDEIFVVLSGSYTVRTEDGEFTARTGEVLYLRAGVSGVYYAPEDALVVAITYPPYREALRKAGRGDDIDALER